MKSGIKREGQVGLESSENSAFGPSEIPPPAAPLHRDRGNLSSGPTLAVWTRV